jgi:hypothetical protein
MATSPNFGWLEPDNTDLVKNGALAIRTLGNAIDASLVDLKGGTTGQVLSKASNTDMDFVWAADAGAPTSLGYAAGKNKIINGDFNINQRAFTSTAVGSVYTFDRWKVFLSLSAGSATYSAQTFTPGTAPVAGYEGTNFFRCVTSGTSVANSASYSFFTQYIEDVRTFANQTVTISFWAKAASGTPKVALELSQLFGSGGSPSATVNTYAGQATLSTSWARYTLTVAVPSISGKTIGTTANTSALLTSFWLTAGADFNSRTGTLGLQDNTFDIWGVQIEAGSVATAFQTATGTIQGELAACQRYYYRVTGEAIGRRLGVGFAGTTTTANITYPLPVTMRVTPTAIETTGTAADYSIAQASGNTTCSTTPAFGVADPYQILFQASVASGLTAGQAISLRFAAANAYVGVTAEL